MAISGWHPRYSTGIKLIDEQHQEIFLTLARLKAAVHMGGEGEDIGELLAHFERITQLHFSAEEGFLGLHGYPDFEAHVLEHRKAQASLKEIAERFASDPDALASTIVDFVHDWLRHHICEGDFKYVQFLKTQGISAT